MRKLRLFEVILIGFVLGVIVGAVVGEPAKALKPFGDLFIRLLSMLVVPLVFASLAVGVIGLEPRRLGRIAAKTFAVYYITCVIAITIGLALANISGVGIGMKLGELAKVEPKAPPPLSRVLLEIVPTNPVAALSEMKMLQIIFFAIIFGIAMTLAGEKSDPVKKALESLAETMYSLVYVVMYYAPIGVFSLIAWTVATHGIKILAPFALLIFLVYLGCALHVGVVYTLILRFFAKVRPFEFLKRIKESPIFAFTTCSSSATLPVTMRVCEENAGISKPLCGFVLPLGATVNMDGTALYQAVSAVFLANAFGMNLTLGGQLAILVTAILASIGTAGVPGAGLIMLMMVLSAVGIPLEGIALIAGIDRILDMARTAVNVMDDAVAVAYVAGSEGESMAEALRI